MAAEILQDIFSRTHHIRIMPGQVTLNQLAFFSLDSLLHLGTDTDSTWVTVHLEVNPGLVHFQCETQTLQRVEVNQANEGMKCLGFPGPS